MMFTTHRQRFAYVAVLALMFQSQLPIQFVWLAAAIVGLAVWDVTRIIKEALIERLVG